MRTTGALNSVTFDADGARGAGNSRSGKTVKEVAGVELPGAIPAFLEARGKLAAEAAQRGDLSKARDLADKAAQVAALHQRDAIIRQDGGTHDQDRSPACSGTSRRSRLQTALVDPEPQGDARLETPSALSLGTRRSRQGSRGLPSG